MSGHPPAIAVIMAMLVSQIIETPIGRQIRRQAFGGPRVNWQAVQRVRLLLRLL
jgi:hypothetical protein